MTANLRLGTRGRAGSLALLLGVFLLIVMVGNAQGGYHPTSWGWIVLGLAWVAAVALVLSPAVTLGRLELAFLASVSLLVGWTALSTAWSTDVEQSVLEVQRALVYLTGALAALLVVQREHVAYLLGGLVAATTWLSIQALGDRLSPEVAPGIQVIFQDRLAGPLGYSNALGLLAVIGALLALGLAIHARPLPLRAAAAAALPILLTTAYFTYSRGALLALAAGLVAAFVLDPRRVTLLTVGALVALPAAAAVWIASRAPALTSASAQSSAIADEGREFAFVLVALTLASAVVTWAIGHLEPRVGVPRAIRRAYVVVLACVAAGLVTAAVVHEGGPGPLAETAYENINRDVASTLVENDLNRRFGGIGSTGRVNYWRVAWQQYEDHPLVGSGAGTFEQFWLRDRTTNEQALDAHGLYIETLAQLGWPGLLALLAMLALPVVAALRARGEPLAIGAFGAYVAYLVQTGIDWSWEMPVLTLLALLCAAALFASREDRASPRLPIPSKWRGAAVAATLAVAVFSVVGLVGNRALAEAERAADRADFQAAETTVRTAVRWAPWSATARGLLGRSLAELGREEEGRAQLRKAIRMNPRDWRLWYDLGLASSGRERERAFVRAATLNPMEPDIEVLRDQGRRLPSRRAQG